MKQKLLHLLFLLMSGVIALSLVACSKENSTSSSLESASAKESEIKSESSSSSESDAEERQIKSESSSSSESDAEESETKSNSSSPLESGVKEDVTSTENSVQPSGDLSEDIYSQQVEINGVVYTFPLKNVQEFMDNGWTTDKELDYTMPKNTTSPGYIFKNSDEHKVTLAFLNQSDETTDVMECNVYYVSMTKAFAESTGISFILPGGIQIGSTYDETITAYGSADEEREHEYSSTTILTYGTNSHNKIELTFDQTADNTLKDITINYKNPVQ